MWDYGWELVVTLVMWDHGWELVKTLVMWDHARELVCPLYCIIMAWNAGGGEG